MQEGWDKPLWIAKLLKQNKQDIMDKLDSIENIFKKAGDATATDSDIVKPKTAYNGNTLLTGTLEDKTGTTSYTANTTLDSTNKLLRMQVPSVGKYGVENYLQQSFATIANLIGLTSAKLLKNNTVLGITGNSSNMDTSSCNAAAAQILSGKKAGVKGNTVTGTMANKAGTTVKASAISQDEDNTYFTIPASGFYDTSSKIYTENSNLSNKINCVSDTFMDTTGGTITVNKPSNFKSSEWTILIFTIEDYRGKESLSVSGASLIKTVVGDRYGVYFDSKYRLYKSTGQTITMNFSYSTKNACFAYLLIDGKYSNCETVSDTVSYSNNDKDLFVSCNLSDNRGFTAITNAQGCVIHYESERKGINMLGYYENMFIAFSLINNGTATINRTTTNQYGKVLKLIK